MESIYILNWIAVKNLIGVQKNILNFEVNLKNKTFNDDLMKSLSRIYKEYVIENCAPEESPLSASTVCPTSTTLTSSWPTTNSNIFSKQIVLNDQLTAITKLKN